MVALSLRGGRSVNQEARNPTALSRHLNYASVVAPFNSNPTVTDRYATGE